MFPHALILHDSGDIDVSYSEIAGSLTIVHPPEVSPGPLGADARAVEVEDLLDDPARVMEVLEDLHVQRPAKRAFCLTDTWQYTMATLRERHTMDGPDEGAISAYCDSVRAKALVQAAGLRVPESVAISTCADVDRVTLPRFPLIVSPRQRTAARGARFVRSPVELRTVLDELTVADRVVVDVARFVPHPIFRCTCVWERGTLSFFALARCSERSPWHPRGPAWSRQVNPSDPQYGSARGFAIEVLGALPLMTTCAHLDIFLTPDGWTFCDVATGIDGAGVPDAVAHSYGVDLHTVAACMYAGRPLPALGTTPYSSSAGATVLATRAGTVVARPEIPVGDDVSVVHASMADVGQRLERGDPLAKLVVTGLDDDAVQASLDRWQDLVGAAGPSSLSPLSCNGAGGAPALAAHPRAPEPGSCEPQPMRPLVAPRSWERASRHLREVLDNEWYAELTHLVSCTLRITQRFFDARGLAPTLMPITVGSVSSPMGIASDSLPVRTSILGRDVYLADSMQFQLELALRHHAEGVYYVMPSFRGEDPDETHLNEFFHSEAEILGDLAAVMALVEDYVRTLAEELGQGRTGSTVRRKVGDNLHTRKLAGMRAFPILEHAEALVIAGREDSSGLQTLDTGDVVLTRTGERRVIDACGGVAWVVRPPHRTVPFYQAFAPDRRDLALAADLLFGTGEVVGSGQRHRTCEELQAGLQLHQVDGAEYSWYAEMKRLTPYQTAGFGMGIERFLMWLLRHDDIRDLQVLPRLKGLPWAV